ncbi:hypothetical protein Lepto7376_1080 [[Leptolyngbya] sp. PCC 7376]|uniref:hypothetical protein n=1 Tax=[Leptolyngbya] sp. PCC 7376 TaxID=111781 RepID=UPI00029F48E5|nr:hypothetical protein [[Leptolyngbya] sp. PCC 7376]AFY37450.1 hypothetical protein Lepto7376_1080 [[Leptolyngbya] sp. PCC 7376]
MANRFSFPNKPEPCPCFFQSAIVSEVLKPHQMGVVHYRGRWIAAVCQLPITLHPDTAVKVICDYGDYLGVLPFVD